jgi:hypothetical protein
MTLLATLTLASKQLTDKAQVIKTCALSLIRHNMKKAQFNYKDITSGNVIDGNIIITCDKCHKDNTNLYVNTDISSFQLDADYVMHQFYCYHCSHLNMMIAFIDE